MNVTAMNTSPDPMTDFIEEIATLCQGDDLSRTAGRIIGLLTLQEEVVSFAFLARELGVSRAGISTNVRLLIEAGIVEQTSLPGDRRDYYRLTPSYYLRQLNRILDRLQRLEAAVERVRHHLPDGKPVTQARLQELQSFHHAIYQSLKAIGQPA
jgi:DNA-binding transcriptional regulator GbsR (MarR family)